MQIINQGTIKVAEFYKDALLYGLSNINLEENAETNVYIQNKRAILEFESYYGDIQPEISSLFNLFKIFGVRIDIDIEYSGDYEGKYVTRNGELIELSETDLVIDNTDDKTLVDELKRRGYNVDSILKQMQEA